MALTEVLGLCQEYSPLGEAQFLFSVPEAALSSVLYPAFVLAAAFEGLVFRHISVKVPACCRT